MAAKQWKDGLGCGLRDGYGRDMMHAWMDGIGVWRSLGGNNTMSLFCCFETGRIS